MSRVCGKSCIRDARDSRATVTAAHVNVPKWSESDAEFGMRSVRSNRNRGVYGEARVVDSKSCRQMYIRSYKFSRKESVTEKIKKCFGKVKEKLGQRRKGKRKRRKCLVWRKVKELSCTTLFRIFRKFLSCAASIDVEQ